MPLHPSLTRSTLTGLATAAALALPWVPAQAQTVLGDTVFTVQGLVGVGRIAANARDEHGETFGSISGLWADRASWTRNGNTYSGNFLAAPDRGYNIAGTIDYAPRLNALQMTFTPAPLGATGLAQTQIALSLTQATRMFEALPGNNGQAFFSGLDPKPGGVATGGARPATGALPELPQAFNGKLSLDAEGVVVLADGSRLVSDEYGPSIYRFAADGRFLGALAVAPSVRPIRNGVTDYSSNNPAAGQPAPSPTNPTSGRANNQGFEGMSLSPDGKTLFVALQSAARQDLGNPAGATRDNTRLFTYDVIAPDDIRLSGEYVVKLPKFQQGTNTLVAAQSEVLALSSRQLLMLPRDSNGFAVGTQTSLLRQVEVIDIGQATNILGLALEFQVAPGGVLNPAIVPAEKRVLLNMLDKTQLNRFGLTNGVEAGFDNLSEKWEGLALLPALDPTRPDDYFLFIANDNDFATTDGFQAGAAYNDGKDIDTMFLAYRVTISAVPEPASALLLLAGIVALAAHSRRRGPA